MEQVRYGIIGVGNMGTTHAEYLFAGEIKGAVLAAICDLKESRRQWAKEKFGADFPVFEDYHELLNSGLCDVVLIATPHYLHPVIAIDAFNAGLNVISEKPVGVYTKAVKENDGGCKELRQGVRGYVQSENQPCLQKDARDGSGRRAWRAEENGLDHYRLVQNPVLLRFR